MKKRFNHLMRIAILVLVFPTFTKGEFATDSPPTVYGEIIDGGCVIIRSEVLSGPYRIGQRGRNILVNDVIAAVLPGMVDENGSEGSDLSRVNPNHFIATLEKRLYNGEYFIVFDNQTRAFFHEGDSAACFMQTLVDADTIETRIQAALSCFSGDDDGVSYFIPTSQWRIALESFEVTESLIQFLNQFKFTDEPDELLDDDQFSDQIISNDPTRWMYALNVAGMLLVVFSAGMLPVQRPKSGVLWLEVIDTSESLRLMQSFLGLILALSIFDLLATLLTNTTGSFIELNPLAGSLIDSPLMLSIFKLSMTCFGVGILWFLRMYAGAQKAAWWLCLILILVTIRWLVILSLFYV